MHPAAGHRARPRHLVPAVLAVGLLAAAGCARYEPQPVDPTLMAELWAEIDAAGIEASIEAYGAAARPTGFDLDDGIDLAEAEAIALFYNPSLRVTRLRAGIPAAGREHAGAWEDPELGIDGGYILDDVEEPWILGAGISITIPLSGRPAVRKRLAAAELGAAEAAALGAEWALLGELRRAWAARAAIDARRELLTAIASELRALVEAAPRFRAARAMTVVDERLLQLEFSRAAGQLRAADTEAERRRLTILSLLGLHPESELPPLVITSPTIPTPPTAAPPLEHPQLRIALAAYAVAERQLELEVRRQYPDLSIGLGGGTEDGEPRVLFGLGLLPIPVWNANKRGIAEARAGRATAAAEVELALQELVQRRAATAARLAAAEDRLAFLQDELVPLIDAQRRDARRLTALGQLDLSLLSDALTASRELRLELLTVRAERDDAALLLAAIDGPHLPVSEPESEPDTEPAGDAP